MAALLSLWRRTPPAEPPIEGALPVLNAGTLLQPHRPLLGTIHQLVGVPQAHWQALYLAAFHAYARFVQQLPASEAHHHAGPGGMLAHGLEVVREALKLRQARLLPAGAAAEELAVRQDLWTYAAATSALLHDIGKPITDQRIQLFDQHGKKLDRWNPWAGPMASEAGWYHVEFVRERKYHYHERVPPLLARFILPQRGLSWLACDAEVFSTWLAAIAGDADYAAILGELVHQADGLSVAADLTGAPARLPSARRKPLAERLLTGLRYLLDQDRLPLNRPGAAGWRLEEDLWLVSKRVLDSLREHLHQEGQDGVPTRNDRLMDELQQHRLLRPNGDRAVWTVRVSVGDWSQQLTVLRFPIHTLWPDPGARPPVFDGSVTLVDENQRRSSADAHPTSLEDAPSPSEASDSDTEGHTSRPLVVEAAVSEPDTTPADTDDPLPLAADGEVLLGPPTTETPEDDDPGRRFLAWLKKGLASGRLAINSVSARVHMVSEGLLLVSPGIFKDFDHENWTQTQKRFQKLKLHERTPQSTNIWRYQVKGARRQSRINGLLIAAPEETLGLQLPPPNPHLSLPE